jgi:hypothetical protein
MIRRAFMEIGMSVPLASFAVPPIGALVPLAFATVRMLGASVPYLALRRFLPLHADSKCLGRFELSALPFPI